jgi:hypothetical protein
MSRFRCRRLARRGPTEAAIGEALENFDPRRLYQKLRIWRRLNSTRFISDDWPNANARLTSLGACLPDGPKPYYFPAARGQPPSLMGRNALSAGVVEISL